MGQGVKGVWQGPGEGSLLHTHTTAGEPLPGEAGEEKGSKVPFRGTGKGKGQAAEGAGPSNRHKAGLPTTIQGSWGGVEGKEG